MKTIFAIFGVGAPDALAPIIEREFKGEHYKVANGEWFVAGAGTAEEVSAKLGITPTTMPTTAIVITMAGYYGRYAAPLWEWIKAKQSADG